MLKDLRPRPLSHLIYRLQPSQIAKLLAAAAEEKQAKLKNGGK